jgi:hypothetical protein
MLVFALLVLATIGAFFATQRLKRSQPVVKRIAVPLYLSPNGDHRKDTAVFSFILPKSDRVTVSIENQSGLEVRRVADDESLGRGKHVFVWDGRTGSGSVAPDGDYYVRVILREQGRAAISQRPMKLITKEPRPRLVSVTPTRVAPSDRNPVKITFKGPASPRPLISVYRTGPGKPRLVDRFQGPRSQNTVLWYRHDHQGHHLGAGTYAFAVTVQNKALVSGSAPRRLPPTAGTARPGTGLTISGPALAGPLEPVHAGGVARMTLTGARGHLRWSLVRQGASRPIRSGRGAVPTVRIGVPSKARTGLYVVRVRSGAGVAAAPLVVRGSGAGGKVLVVLPAMSWQALNPVDDDANGFPNTLENSESVPLARPFAFGQLPAALGHETAPLLPHLGGADLTTDLALSRGHGPGLAGHSGVLFAGSAIWLSEGLDSQLRDYVDRGGKVASFGIDAFHRTVTVGPSLLTGPSPRQQTNVFGEETGPASSEAAPLVVNSDQLGLFAHSDGYVGLFTRFEQEEGLVAGASLLVNAGRDPKTPAFVAYRLGRGIVIRVGVPQWAPSVNSDPEVAAATDATWSFLSR